MESTTYLKITDVCKGYKVERNYIVELNDFGLLKIEEQEKEPCIEISELQKLEKILTFHRDLNINLEGIDVILNLLERIDELNRSLRSAQNKLKIYQQEDFFNDRS